MARGSSAITYRSAITEPTDATRRFRHGAGVRASAPTPRGETLNLNDAIASTLNGKPLADGIAGFDHVEAAPEFKPIPAGIYVTRIVKGEYTTTKNGGTDAYRLRFEVLEGPHTGRTLIRTWTFSAAAIRYTKRDLAQFGLTTTQQLLESFPEAGREYRVQLIVTLQRGDDGIEHNDVKRFDILEVKDSPAVAFMLRESEGGTP